MKKNEIDPKPIKKMTSQRVSNATLEALRNAGEVAGLGKTEAIELAVQAQFGRTPAQRTAPVGMIDASTARWKAQTDTNSTSPDLEAARAVLGAAVAKVEGRRGAVAPKRPK